MSRVLRPAARVMFTRPWDIGAETTSSRWDVRIFFDVMMRYDRRVNKKLLISPQSIYTNWRTSFTQNSIFLRLHCAHRKLNIASTNFRYDWRYGSLLRIGKKRIYTNCYYCLQLIIWLGEETQFFTRRTRDVSHWTNIWFMKILCNWWCVFAMRKRKKSESSQVQHSIYRTQMSIN